MGSCLSRCFGISESKRRQYLRTRYSTERDISIEFENLMEDEPIHDEMSRLVTEREKEILASKQYTELVHEQKRFDKEIDAKLARQEEELRLEEEKFYEAKREAARIAKLQKKKELSARAKDDTKRSEKSWLGDDQNEWEVAGGEDDFELFLANVKARSLKTAAQLRQDVGSGDGSSSSGATTQSKDRSERTQADGSSVDLEWEHEEGMFSQKKPRSSTEENLASSLSHKDSPAHSNELEWDNDFVSAEEISNDTAQLLAAEQKILEHLPR